MTADTHPQQAAWHMAQAIQHMNAEGIDASDLSEALADLQHHYPDVQPIIDDIVPDWQD